MKTRIGPGPLAWLLVVLLSLLAGLASGAWYYHTHDRSAVWPLVACGGAVFVVFGLFSSTAVLPKPRMVYMSICLFGLGVLATGFGIMQYTH